MDHFEKLKVMKIFDVIIDRAVLVSKQSNVQSPIFAIFYSNIRVESLLPNASTRWIREESLPRKCASRTDAIMRSLRVGTMVQKISAYTFHRASKPIYADMRFQMLHARQPEKRYEKKFIRLLVACGHSRICVDGQTLHALHTLLRVRMSELVVGLFTDVRFYRIRSERPTYCRGQ